MSEFYEVYHEDENGDVTFCFIETDRDATLRDMNTLQIENPHLNYWYEITYEDEQ